MELVLDENFKKLFYDINNIIEEGSTLNKEKIKKLFDELAFYMKEVKSQCLFSGNEELDEIPSENLKYLNIPYFQAYLLGQLVDDRKSNLLLSINFLDEFFKVLFNYKIINKNDKEIFFNLINNIKESENKGKENSINYNTLSNKIDNNINTKENNFNKYLVLTRDEKIKEYKDKKALIEKIKYLEKSKKDELDSCKEYFLDLINLNWKNTIEMLRSINTEIESLAFLEKMKEEGKYKEFSKPVDNKGKKLETLKLTDESIKSLDPNNKLLKNLQFGSACGKTNLNSVIDNKLNYKDIVFKNSNPTQMTLDEFADKQIVYMNEQKEMEERSKAMQQNEEDLSDADEEVDDRRKKEKRAWDDWKDLNEKGGGNKNR